MSFELTFVITYDVIYVKIYYEQFKNSKYPYLEMNTRTL